MNIRTDLRRVIIANGIMLMVSILNGFLLPKYLSMVEYAELRTYTLYITYVGILHFGYIDGVFLAYGGRKREDISDYELFLIKRSFVLFQSIVTVVVMVMALCLRDCVLLLAGMSILPINMLMLHRLVFQALGEFSLYKTIVNTVSILTVVFNITLLFVFEVRVAYGYMIAQILANMFALMYCNIHLKGAVDTKIIKIRDFFTTIVRYTISGFAIMIGNGMGLIVPSLDRWFIKTRGSADEFANYSFSVSMIRIMTIVTSAFSITFYTYLCKDHSGNKVRMVRRWVLIAVSMMLIVTQPLRLLIDLFLPTYTSSTKIIVVLFAAQFFVVVVNAIYQNLFKAMKMRKEYTLIMFLVFLLAIALNILAGYLTNNNPMGFAYATLCTAVLWIVVCQLFLNKYSISIKEWIYIIIVMFGYGFCNTVPALLGGVVYLLWCLAVSYMAFKAEMQDYVRMH